MSEKTAFLKLNIFTKILSIMLMVTLVPFGSLWYLNYYRSKETWGDQVALTFNKTATGLVNQVGDWLDMNIKVLQQNSRLEAIRSMDAAQQNPVLKTIVESYQWSYLVFTVRSDGQNIGRSDDNPTTYYGDRKYFKEVIAGKPLGQQVLIGRTSGKPALVLASSIADAKQQGLGVIAMAMHLEDISQTITNAKIGQTGFAILLDQAGKAIAHGRPEVLREALQDFSQHPALHNSQSNNGLIVYEEDGKSVIAYTQKTSQGWTVIVQQDYDEAFSSLYEVQRNSFILLGFSLILIIAISYLFSQRLAKPIQQLTIVANKISKGELNETIVATDRNDEIGALARAIERMGVSLKMALERLRLKS